MEKLFSSTNNLITFLSEEGYKGHDPYDCLKSPYFQSIENRHIRLGLTYFFRQSPINLRNLFKIPKSYNPKALGLFLSSYSKLFQLGWDINLELLEKLFILIVRKANKSYSGLCWGFDFPWQNRHRLLPSFTPTVVATSIVGNSLLDYYEVTKKRTALKAAISASEFILNDLNLIESKFFYFHFI